ncbi:hypothetical protein KAR02_14195 [Candidatus Bipolaricaulota bacterium]|nr:hypothetical protein [Candidatus Bipolaricaulota bacterium]
MTSWTALRDGFDAFTTRLPLLLSAWLVILACQQVIDLLIPDSMLLVESIISMIVLAPLYAGQHLLALKVVRGESVVFKELFAGKPQLGPILGAYLLVNLLIVLGAVVLIIPGIIVALMFSFVLIRFLDPKEGARTVRATEAMRESAQITRGYRGTLFGIGLLLAVPYLVLGVLLWISAYDSSIPTWAIEIFAILSGTLFLGPVQATSYMVVYDYALNHPRV